MIKDIEKKISRIKKQRPCKFAFSLCKLLDKILIVRGK